MEFNTFSSQTKLHKQMDSHGIFWGFCLCVFSLPEEMIPKKQTHELLFAIHPVPGQSPKLVFVYVFFLSALDAAFPVSTALSL